MVLFSSLQLKKDMLSALEVLGFTEATDVQSKIIPLALSRKNVVFTSQTGSGKTLAYSLAALSRINPKGGLQMLVVVPTRELAIQVTKELKAFGKILGFSTESLYGGNDLIGDRRTISRKFQVLVATPGRLIQHVHFKTIKLGDVSYLVFDEADHMFDTGFLKDCTYIKSRVSITAQLLLASATITPVVEKFLKKEFENFEFIQVGSLIPEAITQDVLFCDIKEKLSLTARFFDGEDFSKAIIFVNTKAKASSIYDTLFEKDFSVGLLTGDLDQKARERAMKDFIRGKFSILVCTDVAARGLDVDDVDIVLNYDVPNKSEFYVHRIGRAARKGKDGYALTFICPEDEDDFIVIEKEFNLSVGEVNHDFELVD